MVSDTLCLTVKERREFPSVCGSLIRGEILGLGEGRGVLAVFSQGVGGWGAEALGGWSHGGRTDGRAFVCS